MVQADWFSSYRRSIRIVVQVVGVALVGCSLSACAASGGVQRTSTEQGEATLRELALRRGLLIGTMVRAHHLNPDEEPAYRDVVASEFSLVTAPCYFRAVQPTLNEFDFDECDTVVDFGNQHGLHVRGHTLVWGNALPGWLEALPNVALWQVLHHHVSTLVSRYRGRTLAWDVVNEAVNPDGKGDDGIIYRDTSFWFRRLGPLVYDSAFWWAHLADSTAALFYNDHSLERSGAWGMAIYDFVAGLKRRQVPITGVGLQFHVTINTRLDTLRIRADMERLAALDLDLHITELDVLIGHSPATADELTRQARVYQTVLGLCLAVSRCTAFSIWGFTDRRQSRAGVTWKDDPLIFDREYRRKPAYLALWAELRKSK